MSDQQELWVVELDDPGEFPAPSWGPFASPDEAAEFVRGAVLWSKSTVLVARDFAGAEISRVYELSNGKYMSIKKLTPPVDFAYERELVGFNEPDPIIENQPVQ